MNNLKHLRRLKNLKQKKVALDLNISRVSLSNYENGKREPSIRPIIKMAKYYNVTVHYILTGEEFKKRWTIFCLSFLLLIFLMSICF